MVRDTNMNLEVPQCKNCWKWSYITFACYAHGFKYIKCNSLYKVEHHRHFAWCCKVNFKINPSKLETKSGKLCPHSFKYINCKWDHQADSNECLF